MAEERDGGFFSKLAHSIRRRSRRKQVVELQESCDSRCTRFLPIPFFLAAPPCDGFAPGPSAFRIQVPSLGLAAARAGESGG